VLSKSCREATSFGAKQTSTPLRFFFARVAGDWARRLTLLSPPPRFAYIQDRLKEAKNLCPLDPKV
jgi:hypothetical protein